MKISGEDKPSKSSICRAAWEGQAWAGARKQANVARALLKGFRMGFPTMCHFVMWIILRMRQSKLRESFLSPPA